MVGLFLYITNFTLLCTLFLISVYGFCLSMQLFRKLTRDVRGYVQKVNAQTLCLRRHWVNILFVRIVLIVCGSFSVLTMEKM